MQAQALPLAHRISKACEKLAVSRATIYRLAKAGTIEFVKLGKGSTRVTDVRLRQSLESKTIAPG